MPRRSYGKSTPKPRNTSKRRNQTRKRTNSRRSQKGGSVRRINKSLKRINKSLRRRNTSKRRNQTRKRTNYRRAQKGGLFGSSTEGRVKTYQDIIDGAKSAKTSEEIAKHLKNVRNAKSDWAGRKRRTTLEKAKGERKLTVAEQNFLEMGQKFDAVLDELDNAGDTNASFFAATDMRDPILDDTLAARKEPPRKRAAASADAEQVAREVVNGIRPVGELPEGWAKGSMDGRSFVYLRDNTSRMLWGPTPTTKPKFVGVDLLDAQRRERERQAAALAARNAETLAKRKEPARKRAPRAAGRAAGRAAEATQKATGDFDADMAEHNRRERERRAAEATQKSTGDLDADRAEHYRRERERRAAEATQKATGDFDADMAEHNRRERERRAADAQ